jgi:hypothetical protein
MCWVICTKNQIFDAIGGYDFQSESKLYPALGQRLCEFFEFLNYECFPQGTLSQYKLVSVLVCYAISGGIGLWELLFSIVS